MFLRRHGSPNNLCVGFKKPGIYPFNPDAVDIIPSDDADIMPTTKEQSVGDVSSDREDPGINSDGKGLCQCMPVI